MHSIDRINLEQIVKEKTTNFCVANQDFFLEKAEIEKLVFQLVSNDRDIENLNASNVTKDVELVFATIALLFRNVKINKQETGLLESPKVILATSNSVKIADRYNRSLIEVSIDPFMMIGPGGIITDVNSATEKMTGVNRGDMIGTLFSDYFTDYKRAELGYQEVFTNGSVRDYNLVIKHIDGHTTSVIYNASVYKDDKGEVIGVFAAARDITTILEAEKHLNYVKDNLEILVQSQIAELQNGQLLLKSCLESPREMIILALDKNYNYLYFNQSHKNAMKYAYGKDVEKGMNLIDQITSESDRIKSKERYDLALSGVAHSTIEKWGDIVVSYYETYYNPILDERGNFIGCTAFARDVTERITQEEKIKELNNILENRVQERTEQLISVNKELIAFSYSISHDLKSPLRHITGYISLFRKKFGADLPPESKQYLDYITDSAKNMGELIEGLLQYSAVGRTEMNKTMLEMEDMVKSIIQPIKLLDTDQRIQWTIETLPNAYCDLQMMRVVWGELIENAMKFTKNVAKPQIIIGSYQKDNESIYYVKDNGAGFDMKYVSKLFTVFQRLHSNEDFEGTGIGLASVNRIISRHGGRTWAEGEVGKGATIYFSLLR